MTWSSVDWTATEAVVGRIQDRIFRAAKIKRPRLEPDDEQSSCPVLRGLGSGNGARLPDWIGGLVSLAVVVVRARTNGAAGPRAAAALRRFSRYGAIFVAGIALTGLINTWHMLEGRLDLASSYDRVLFAKVALFTMMVTVAALNRYRLVPRSDALRSSPGISGSIVLHRDGAVHRSCGAARRERTRTDEPVLIATEGAHDAHLYWAPRAIGHTDEWERWHRRLRTTGLEVRPRCRRSNWHRPASTAAHGQPRRYRRLHGSDGNGLPGCTPSSAERVKTRRQDPVRDQSAEGPYRWPESHCARAIARHCFSDAPGLRPGRAGPSGDCLWHSGQRDPRRPQVAPCVRPIVRFVTEQGYKAAGSLHAEEVGRGQRR